MSVGPEAATWSNRLPVRVRGVPNSSFLLIYTLCALVPSDFVWAQLTQPGVVFARSRSGQFVIHSKFSPVVSTLGTSLQRNTNFVRLEPALLTVSCERIKQILGRELGLPDAWSGKVFLKIYPVNSPDDPITLTSEQFKDCWQYELSLPNIIERDRYARAMVRVLLLEFANRGASEHGAELPLWLVEGLSEQLVRSSELEIILPPPEDSAAGIPINTVIVNARKQNPLELAHQQLCAGQALTFQQLSWPDAEQLVGNAGEIYRSSAQLFVDGLLSLADGKACLRRMLTELPHYYNWQFAFLQAFHGHFQRPLDLEKWWSLHLAHFTGRQLAQTWSVEETWQKLDQIIRSAVEVRVNTNDLPLRMEIPLQTMLREWDRARQVQALQAKLLELEAAHLRSAPALLPITEDYTQTIEGYLQNLGHSSAGFLSHKKAGLRRSRQETLLHLDELDAQRAVLKPAPKTSPLVQTDLPGAEPR